jgi:hypothetical protein
MHADKIWKQVVLNHFNLKQGCGSKLMCDMQHVKGTCKEWGEGA